MKNKPIVAGFVIDSERPGLNSFDFWNRFSMATPHSESAVPVVVTGVTNASSPAFSLASGNFSQDWSSTSQITVNDDWSGVPGIVGYRTGDVTSATGVDARTITTDTGFVVNVLANSTSASQTGGILEVETGAALGTPPNTTIGMQGANANDYAAIVIYLDSTTRQNIRLTANIRDIDSSADNAIQQVVVQYRIGSAGAWTNVVGGYYADVTTAGTATQVTAVDLTLPADANNVSDLEIRILTTNAAGNDELIGIDDIVVSSNPIASVETQTVVFSPISVSHGEGDSGATAYVFTVTRTGGSTGQLNFSGSFANGGTDNADYVGGSAPTSFSGSILAGQNSATVTINVAGDFAIESNENFTLALTNVSNTDSAVVANIGANATATGTIVNDDAAGVISVDDVSLAEGDTGTTAGSFTLHRTGGSSGTVSVQYLITLPGGSGGADGTDVSGPLTGTATFAEGQTTASIPFTINGDITNEPDETFSVALSGPTGGATIGDGNAVATILNDDSPPTISIGDATLTEGDGGVTYMIFTISLSKPSIDPVSVDFATSNGTATAGSDYLAFSGHVSFAVGETSQTISVPIIGDTRVEANETINVTLSNPAGAAISDGSAVGTIVDNDGPAYFSLAGGNFSQDWSNVNQITANDNWSGVPFIVGHLGQDITTSTGVNPQTLLTDSLLANDVDVIANQTNPNTQTSGGVAEFDTLANPTVALQGSGTADAPHLILYMDSTGRDHVIVSYDLRDVDGSTDNAVQPVALQYRIGNSGSWTNVPAAFVADASSGPSLATLVTHVSAELPAEASNQAALQLRIITTNAVGNDEWIGVDNIVVSSSVSAPTLSIADAALFEGNSGTSVISFVVTRVGDATIEVTADYSVNFGTGPFDANAADFAPGQIFTGSVHFGAGETSATISLNVQGDTVAEGDDGFTVSLSNAVGAGISDGTAIGTIVNDDGPPSLITVTDVSVAEGNAGQTAMTFTVNRTGGAGAFSVQYHTADGTATAADNDYLPASGTLNFAAGQNSQTVTVFVNGDTNAELSETLQLILTNPSNGALIGDGTGIGTIQADDPLFIHQIQGTSYFSPILASEGIHSLNTASSGTVIIRAVVTAVDNDGPRQGFYVTEEMADWDGNNFTSEGIFVMTRNDAGVGDAVTGIAVGDLVTVTAHVMEYRGFASNMPITALTSPSSIVVEGHGNPLPTLVLDSTHYIPNEVMTGVTPDYFDSQDDAGDSFDAATYGLSFWETVEGMLVTIPNMVVSDGFVSTSGGRPFFQAYSLDHANADQINSRGGYTIAGDPPIGQPDTPETGDDTHNGGRVLHDGDVNPDVIEVDFSGWSTATVPTGLAQNASMGDHIGAVTGIIDFDFTERKLFVTDINASDFVNNVPTREVTALGVDTRSLTVATFNVENLDPSDGAPRFTALANAIANNLHSPDIISIEEMQDNNGAAAGDGISPTGTDASTTWTMLVNALNALTGAHYQWVDEAPVYNAEGGEQSGNIRVGFLYNTDRVQLGNLDANATLAERRAYTDRIGDGVRDSGDLIAFSDDMLGSEINTNDWTGTRKSLLGQFTFNGNTVFVTANHFPAKGGSGSFWQYDQNLENGSPANSGWAQRNAVAQDVYSMLNLVQSGAPNAGIVSGGDYNDFYFYRPLTTVTGYTMADGTARVGGARFQNLTLTLPEAERYTYDFDGRSQAIDHIIVNDLLGGVATYDVVHINTGYNPAGTGIDAITALSDHDPALSSFDFRGFAEVLTGTAANDLLEGFGGNDVLIGGGGNDDMRGGTGNDVYYVQDAGDLVTEAFGEGVDRIAAAVSFSLSEGSEVEKIEAITQGDITAINVSGNEFAQTIVANNGANVLDGAGGNDVLVGLGGNDTLIGGGGSNLMYGGAGDDTYYAQDAGDNVFENAGEGNDRVAASASFTLSAGSEVETLEAITQSATNTLNLSGNALAQKIIGNAGANLLDGGDGNDLLVGLGGSDILIGGGGSDAMYGGAGDDIYYVQDVGDQVYESAGEGVDRIATSVSYALASGSEIETLEAITQSDTAPLDLTGNEFSQTIIGNAGANHLDGGGGADILVALAGNDSLIGGTGADVMYGGLGNDTYYVDQLGDLVVEIAGEGADRVAASSSYVLAAGTSVETLEAVNQGDNSALDLKGNEIANLIVGNSGANILDGGGGSDIMVGLGGNDTFAFSTSLGATNVDLIVDFQVGMDKIALDDAIFTALGLGTLPSSAFHVGLSATDADQRVLYDSATGNLYYDQDGAGGSAAVLFATLQSQLGLTAADFQVI